MTLIINNYINEIHFKNGSWYEYPHPCIELASNAGVSEASCNYTQRQTLENEMQNVNKPESGGFGDVVFLSKEDARATARSIALSMSLRGMSNLSVSSATCSLTGVSESITSLSVSDSASLTLSSGSSILENYLARTNSTLSYHKVAATITLLMLL